MKANTRLQRVVHEQMKVIEWLTASRTHTSDAETLNCLPNGVPFRTIESITNFEQKLQENKKHQETYVKFIRSLHDEREYSKYCTKVQQALFAPELTPKMRITTVLHLKRPCKLNESLVYKLATGETFKN